MGIGEWHIAKKADRNQRSVEGQIKEFGFYFKI